jgi:carboxylesterase
VRGTRDAFELPGAGTGPGKGRGALVIHGFSGSPYEVRYLGERLAERGFHVVGPALAGHAHGDPDELDLTRWQDWYGSATEAFDALRERFDQVVVAGLSMGGLLGFRLAFERHTQVSALAALAVPIWLPAHIEVAIRGVNHLVRAVGHIPVVGRRIPPLHVPKLAGVSDIADAEMRAANPTMPAMPVRALLQLVELQARVRRELPGVKVPLFVAHARHDHTAPYSSASGILHRVGSRDVRAMSLAESFHVITIDRERAELARAVGDFFEERLR